MRRSLFKLYGVHAVAKIMIGCPTNLCEYFVSIHGQHKIRGIRDASAQVFLDHH